MITYAFVLKLLLSSGSSAQGKSSVRIAWRTPLGMAYRLRWPASVIQNRVAAVTNESVVAVDQHSGKKSWETRFGGKVYGPASGPGAFFVCFDGKWSSYNKLAESPSVCSLNPSDGKLIWKTELNGYPTGEPAFGDSGLVCVGASLWKPGPTDQPGFYNDAGQLIGIDAKTGSLRWRVIGGLFGVPRVIPGRIVVCESTDKPNSSYVTCVRTRDGRVLWRKQSDGFSPGHEGEGIPMPVVSSTGLVFVGTSKSVFAFDASGKQLWQHAEVALPVVVSSSLYVATRTGLEALDPYSGREHWSKSYHDYGIYPFVLGPRGNLYCSSPGPHLGDQAVAALDSSNGDLKWRLRVGGSQPIYSAQVVGDNGLVFVVTDDRDLIAIQTEK